MKRTKIKLLPATWRHTLKHSVTGIRDTCEQSHHSTETPASFPLQGERCDLAPLFLAAVLSGEIRRTKTAWYSCPTQAYLYPACVLWSATQKWFLRTLLFLKHDFDPNLRGISLFLWRACRSETLQYHKFEFNFAHREIPFNFRVPRFLILLLISTPVQTECKTASSHNSPITSVVAFCTRLAQMQFITWD